VAAVSLYYFFFFLLKKYPFYPFRSVQILAQEPSEGGNSEWKCEDEVTPLEFLEAVYLNEELPLSVRMRAAIEAAPYRHPKLAVSAIATYREDFATALERCIIRSGIKPLPSPKVIEATVVEQVSASEMKAPFPTYRNNYRRR